MLGAGPGQGLWSTSWRDHLVLKYTQPSAVIDFLHPSTPSGHPRNSGKPDDVPKQHRDEALAPALQGCGHWEVLLMGPPHTQAPAPGASPEASILSG